MTAKEKKKILNSIEQAMIHYEQKCLTSSNPDYWEGVVDGMNKVFRYIDRNGKYDLTV